MAMAQDPQSKRTEPVSMVMALLGLVHMSSFVFSVFSLEPARCQQFSEAVYRADSDCTIMIPLAFSDDSTIVR